MTASNLILVNGIGFVDRFAIDEADASPCKGFGFAPAACRAAHLHSKESENTVETTVSLEYVLATGQVKVEFLRAQVGGLYHTEATVSAMTVGHLKKVCFWVFGIRHPHYALPGHEQGWSKTVFDRCDATDETPPRLEYTIEGNDNLLVSFRGTMTSFWVDVAVGGCPVAAVRAFAKDPYSKMTVRLSGSWEIVY